MFGTSSYSPTVRHRGASAIDTTGSVLAAFLAGGVALFAPCCIVFLAPSYLAVAVKDRRWRLLPNTFVFAAGWLKTCWPNEGPGSGAAANAPAEGSRTVPAAMAARTTRTVFMVLAFGHTLVTGP